MVKLANPVYTGWILAAICKVRAQKQRPSEARVCQAVSLAHGLDTDTVREQLELSVQDRAVLRVLSKGQVSYRDPAQKSGHKLGHKLGHKSHGGSGNGDGGGFCEGNEVRDREMVFYGGKRARRKVRVGAFGPNRGRWRGGLLATKTPKSPRKPGKYGRLGAATHEMSEGPCAMVTAVVEEEDEEDDEDREDYRGEQEAEMEAARQRSAGEWELLLRRAVSALYTRHRDGIGLAEVEAWLRRGGQYVGGADARRLLRLAGRRCVETGRLVRAGPRFLPPPSKWSHGMEEDTDSLVRCANCDGVFRAPFHSSSHQVPWYCSVCSGQGGEGPELKVPGPLCRRRFKSHGRGRPAKGVGFFTPSLGRRVRESERERERSGEGGRGRAGEGGRRRGGKRRGRGGGLVGMGRGDGEDCMISFSARLSLPPISNEDLELFTEAHAIAEERVCAECGCPGEPCARHPAIIVCGTYAVDTWYSSPYPAHLARLHTLYVCESCLCVFPSSASLARHSLRCQPPLPPGPELYRHGNLAVFQVDGKQSKPYCQNLCLLAKLFLDHKTLYYDVEPFLFYVLTRHDAAGSHLVGYFSKEKLCQQRYNVSCLMVLPQYQRLGYGQLLIDFSYLLSRKEGKAGTPEKPLSELGRLSYTAYWRRAILTQLLGITRPASNPGDKSPKVSSALTLSLAALSKATGACTADLASTLAQLGLLGRRGGRFVIFHRQSLLDTFEESQKSRPQRLALDAEALHWTPSLTGASEIEKNSLDDDGDEDKEDEKDGEQEDANISSSDSDAEEEHREEDGDKSQERERENMAFDSLTPLTKPRSAKRKPLSQKRRRGRKRRRHNSSVTTETISETTHVLNDDSDSDSDPSMPRLEPMMEENVPGGEMGKTEDRGERVGDRQSSGVGGGGEGVRAKGDMPILSLEQPTSPSLISDLAPSIPIPMSRPQSRPHKRRGWPKGLKRKPRPLASPLVEEVSADLERRKNEEGAKEEVLDQRENIVGHRREMKVISEILCEGQPDNGDSCGENIKGNHWDIENIHHKDCLKVQDEELECLDSHADTKDVKGYYHQGAEDGHQKSPIPLGSGRKASYSGNNLQMEFNSTEPSEKLEKSDKGKEESNWMEDKGIGSSSQLSSRHLCSPDKESRHGCRLVLDQLTRRGGEVKHNSFGEESDFTEHDGDSFDVEKKTGKADWLGSQECHHGSEGEEGVEKENGGESEGESEGEHVKGEMEHAEETDGEAEGEHEVDVEEMDQLRKTKRQEDEVDERQHNSKCERPVVNERENEREGENEMIAASEARACESKFSEGELEKESDGEREAEQEQEEDGDFEGDDEDRDRDDDDGGDDEREREDEEADHEDTETQRAVASLTACSGDASPGTTPTVAVASTVAIPEERVVGRVSPVENSNSGRSSSSDDLRETLEACRHLESPSPPPSPPHHAPPPYLPLNQSQFRGSAASGMHVAQSETNMALRRLEYQQQRFEFAPQQVVSATAPTASGTDFTQSVARAPPPQLPGQPVTATPPPQRVTQSDFGSRSRTYNPEFSGSNRYEFLGGQPQAYSAALRPEYVGHISAPDLPQAIGRQPYHRPATLTLGISARPQAAPQLSVPYAVIQGSGPPLSAPRSCSPLGRPPSSPLERPNSLGPPPIGQNPGLSRALKRMASPGEITAAPSPQLCGQSNRGGAERAGASPVPQAPATYQRGGAAGSTGETGLVESEVPPTPIPYAHTPPLQPLPTFPTKTSHSRCPYQLPANQQQARTTARPPAPSPNQIAPPKGAYHPSKACHQAACQGSYCPSLSDFEAYGTGSALAPTLSSNLTLAPRPDFPTFNQATGSFSLACLQQLTNGLMETQRFAASGGATAAGFGGLGGPASRLGQGGAQPGRQISSSRQLHHALSARQQQQQQPQQQLSALQPQPQHQLTALQGALSQTPARCLPGPPCFAGFSPGGFSGARAAAGAGGFPRSACNLAPQADPQRSLPINLQAPHSQGPPHAYGPMAGTVNGAYPTAYSRPYSAAQYGGLRPQFQMPASEWTGPTQAPPQTRQTQPACPDMGDATRGSAAGRNYMGR
uniref:histone acetyltransferase KAT6B-like isoform X3 n=1 Tax=Myxine glutinosa TaxID=7769 RepID=UPI00358E219A